jgi:cytochrome c553
MLHNDNRNKSSSAFSASGVAILLTIGVAMAGPSAAQDAKTIAATVCVGCHAEDGNSLVPMFPKIAGLQESYIIKQLRDFQSGRRKSDIMAPVVAALKPQDIGPLAAYFSAQKLKPGEVTDKASVGFGKMVYFEGNEETGVPACVGCHQAQGAGHLIYPRIGGQHSVYVAQQLKNFAAGDRSNDANRFMRVVAKRMSEEEIQSVAEYLVSLDSK